MANDRSIQPLLLPRHLRRNHSRPEKLKNLGVSRSHELSISAAQAWTATLQQTRGLPELDTLSNLRQHVSLLI